MIENRDKWCANASKQLRWIVGMLVMELTDLGVGAGTAKTINRKGNHIWKDSGMDSAVRRELKHTQAIFGFDHQQRVPD